MSPEDAALSIERHATSKIAAFEDLVRVSTLGFRGEALPSIGSVSRMTIITRPKTDLEGTRVVVEGGEVREVSPAGCPPGTTVEVNDLFYNVPARKKFLRARQTETSTNLRGLPTGRAEPPGAAPGRNLRRAHREAVPASEEPRGARVSGLRRCRAPGDPRRARWGDPRRCPGPGRARPCGGAPPLPIRQRPAHRRPRTGSRDRVRIRRPTAPRALPARRGLPSSSARRRRRQRSSPEDRGAVQADRPTGRSRDPNGRRPASFCTGRRCVLGGAHRRVWSNAGRRRAPPARICLPERHRLHSSAASMKRAVQTGFASSLRFASAYSSARARISSWSWTVTEPTRSYATTRFAKRRPPGDSLIRICSFPTGWSSRPRRKPRSNGMERCCGPSGSTGLRSVRVRMSCARSLHSSGTRGQQSSSGTRSRTWATAARAQKDAVLRALASRAATANGEPLDDTDAQRIVARVWPSRDAHRSCIVARVPLALASTEDDHA